MVDSVESCRKVEKSEKRDFVRVGCQKELIDYVEKSSFCAMVGTVGRLERVEEVVGRQVVVQLLQDDFFKEFGNERKVRDRAIVF